MQARVAAVGLRNRSQLALLSVTKGVRSRSGRAVVSIKRKWCMKRPNIGTEGGLSIQYVSSDSSSVCDTLRADRPACEGENGERLQSAQRVKELVGRRPRCPFRRLLTSDLKASCQHPLNAALTQGA